jgi:hypothetical protein
MKNKIYLTFEEWQKALATTPAHKLHTREDFAFCDSNSIPEEHREAYGRFREAWKSRFAYRDTIQGITHAGWYHLSAKACEGVYSKYPERLRTTINVWSPQRLANIRHDWEKTFPGKGAEAPVVVRVEIDPKFGPWIAELSRPIAKPLKLVHGDGSNWWTLGDDWGFSVELPPPGYIAFQRAAMLIYCNRGGWYDTSAIILEWIFAGGHGNALGAADAALSGRAGETIASARRMVRAAMA